MYNLKLTANAACAGFILSILSGLIGGVNFGILLLRALVCGLLCGFVSMGGYALYKKFLDSDFASPSFSPSVEKDEKGKNVDIILDDEPLPDEAFSPGFVVDEEKESIATPQSTADSEEENQDFEAVETVSDDADFQVLPVDSVAQSYQNDIVNKESEVQEKVSDESDLAEKDSTEIDKNEIQDLPDIGTILGDLDSDVAVLEPSKENEDNVIEDSTFALTGDSKSQKKTADDSSANAEELAAAIRTVIAKDN